jgi:hypothetical protein
VNPRRGTDRAVDELLALTLRELTVLVTDPGYKTPSAKTRDQTHHMGRTW